MCGGGGGGVGRETDGGLQACRKRPTKLTSIGTFPRPYS